jgi:hypothetical protein
MATAPFGEADHVADDGCGHELFGYDEEGGTTWYYSDGTCDCRSDAPSDDDWDI